jgi:hypothetical protein
LEAIKKSPPEEEPREPIGNFEKAKKYVELYNGGWKFFRYNDKTLESLFDYEPKWYEFFFNPKAFLKYAVIIFVGITILVW